MAISIEEKRCLVHHSRIISMVWKKPNKTQQRAKNIAIHKDMWKKQQDSERKPGLPTASSPEITQGEPHGHNRSHVWKIPEWHSHVIIFFSPLLRPISLWGSVLILGEASKQIKNIMKYLGFIISRQIINQPWKTLNSSDDTQIPRPDLRFANRKNSNANKERGRSQNTHTKNHRICLGHGGKPTVSLKHAL